VCDDSRLTVLLNCLAVQEALTVTRASPKYFVRRAVSVSPLEPLECVLIAAEPPVHRPVAQFVHAVLGMHIDAPLAVGVCASHNDRVLAFCTACRDFSDISCKGKDVDGQAAKARAATCDILG